MHFDSIEPGVYPELIYPPYKSTMKRGPTQPALRSAAPRPGLKNLTPAPRLFLANDVDLTAQGDSAALGEKIVVTGRVCDEDGKPVHNSLLEVWQCNAAGRYRHKPVFARGLVKRQFTAVFLEDDVHLAASAILEQVPQARRATLLAGKLTDGAYRRDIWMQTDKETVFFDYV